MIDRAKFFASIRSSVFGGSLAPTTVQGITAVLDEWDRRKLTDLRWLSYMLATMRGEVGVNMLPVREGFASSDTAARVYVRKQKYKYAAVVNGQVYYGRGLVQLTWDTNYKKMGALLGIDLLGNPDFALKPDVAAKIMFEGMIRGSFTGKKLADYFTVSKTDWLGARRIINGTDKAAQFAAWARAFNDALVKADKPPSAEPAKDAGKAGAKQGLLALIFGGIAAAFAWLVQHPVIAVAATAALIAIGVFGWRWWKNRKEAAAAPAPIIAMPELAPEIVATAPKAKKRAARKMPAKKRAA